MAFYNHCNIKKISLIGACVKIFVITTALLCENKETILNRIPYNQTAYIRSFRCITLKIVLEKDDKLLG